MELRIFADQRDLHLHFGILHRVHDPLPICEIRFRTGDLQTFADHFRQMFLLHHERNLVDRRRVEILHNVCNGHIAEQGDLVAHGLRDLILRSAHNDIRADPHSLQFPDACLGGLGLEFFRAMQIGHECHMDHAAGALRLLLHELADRLVDRLGFDISHCAAHFDDRNGGIRPLG